MRKRKKKAIWITMLSTIIFVGFCIIAIHSVRLEKIGYRSGEYSLTETQRKSIELECAGITDIEILIDKCGKFVCNQLIFAYRNDFNNGQANCVGYAKFHVAVLNHAFKINDLPNRARPVYGKAHLWRIDLHPLFKSIVPKSMSHFSMIMITLR